MSKIKIGVVITSLYIKLNAELTNQALCKLREYFEVKLYLPDCDPDEFGSIPIATMVRQINKASKECEVLLSYCGGFNQIELLSQFERLKINQSNIFVGKSDNTILANSLPTLGICRSLYGKGFYDLAKYPDSADESIENLYQSLTNKDLRLTGYKILQGGDGKGKLVGGNNYTFDLLQGTKFLPKLDESFVLFMEGEDLFKDSKEVWIDFIRNIDSVMLQEGALGNLAGLIIGKFPDSVKIKKEYWTKFVGDREYLKGIPLIYDYPCGHNLESNQYLPIGQEISIKC